MFDLWSCMVSLTYLTIDIEILVILPYITSYFITSELYIIPSNTNTRKNELIQNNNSNNNNDCNNENKNSNKNYFNNNISKYYWKIRNNDILCFHNFGSVVAAQGFLCNQRIRKGVIKL